jgi:hypothetical protein
LQAYHSRPFHPPYFNPCLAPKGLRATPSSAIPKSAGGTLLHTTVPGPSKGSGLRKVFHCINFRGSLVGPVRAYWISTC